MAIVNTQRSTRPTRARAAKKAPQRRGRKLWWLGALVLLLVIVWQAPLLVAKTALLDRVINWATADLNGSVQVRSASLGWFLPVKLDGITLRDSSGKLVCEVPSVVCENSLWALVWSPSEIGTIRINAPKLLLEVGKNGINLERMVADYVSDTSEDEESNSTSDAISTNLIVTNATIEVYDLTSGRRWQIDDLEARALLSGAGTKAEMSLAGKLRGNVTSRFEVELEAPLEDPFASQTVAGSHATAGQGHFNLTAEAFPLALVAACLRSRAAGLQLDGRATANLACQWTGATNNPASATVDGHLSVEDLLAAGSWLKSDQLRLGRLQTTCRVAKQGENLKCEKLDLICDLGRAAFQGTLPADGNWRRAALQETYKLDGDIDLARLASALPDTIRLRDDTQITAGRVQIALNRLPAENLFLTTGQLRAEGLTGTHAGRAIEWREPLVAELTARDSGDDYFIDRLRCTSSFLELDGSGTTENFSAQTRFDLDQLSTRLEQFFDLGSLKMAGQGQGGLSIRKAEDQTLRLDGQIDVERLLLAAEGRPTWQDDRLTALVSLTARTDSGSWHSIDSARLQVDSGADRLSLRLTQPVADPQNAESWPAQLELAGELARWHARLAPFTASLDAWQIQGQCDLSAAANYSSAAIDVADAHLRIDNLRAAGPGMTIEEPLLEASGGARLDYAGQSLRTQQLALASQTLSASCEDLELNWAADGPPMGRGKIVLRGDMNRLHGWLQGPDEPATYQVYGLLDGELQFDSRDGANSVDLDAAVEQWAVAWDQDRVWREPQVRLIARALHEQPGDALRLARFELSSAGLACAAQGQIGDLDGDRMLELHGQVRYDLEQLEPLLRAFAGEGVRIAARGEQPFSIRGPLAQPAEELPTAVGAVQAGEVADATLPSSIARLEARAAVDWQSADIYGFLIGPGQLDAELSPGLLAIAPLSLQVSEGRFQASPLIRFEPGPAELQLGPTQLFDQVRISPAMSQQALKYVAPVLAGVSRAEGRFSIELDGCRVPLSAPGEGDLGGRMTVHSMQISAGPMIEQFVSLFGRPQAIQLAEQSVVAFRMVGGRVYHEGLQLVWPDATIRTHGSVGLDGTLAVMAEMPVPEKWIGNNPLGESLRQKTIRLPIGGTLARPKLDQQALQRASAEILRDAGASTIRRELGRQLDRLLGPPRQ